MNLRPYRAPWTALAIALALGCSGTSTPRPQTTTTNTTATASDGGTTATATASPWASHTRETLSALVTEQATARIREVQPDFDPARLADYRAHPEQAPELLGRTVERLLDLATVDLANNRLAEAEGTVRLVRARARNRNSAYAANTILAETKRRAAGEDTAAQRAAVEAVFRELPRERFGGATVVFQLYQTERQVRAQLDELHEQMVSLETASRALWLGEVMPTIVANRESFLAVIEVVRAAHNAQPATPDYTFPTVDLATARDAREVVVGVWDLGTNPELFRNQMFANPGEQANGQDDDHNGLVDDLQGVVSDGDAPNTALLYDPGQELLSRYSPFLRGVMDLRAGMASSEAARRVLELYRSVSNADEQRTLERSLDAVGEWAHGTHVAGIMLAGLPQARLTVFRSAWAGEARPYFHRGPTDAELDAERANMERVAEFLNRHHVRVVNASLGFSEDYLESELRYERETYRTDEAVRARARAIQERRRANWQWVIERCPETLFVVAAGNSNRDVVEYGETPGGNTAANLLSVGAVDRYGRWATFTNSNPERVRIFDHGVEVDSLVPSGERVPLSGTSMASPNVANLAAKLVALDPALTPARVIEVILATADPIAAPFNGRIVNEVRAVERVRRERGRAPRPGTTPARRTGATGPAR